MTSKLVQLWNKAVKAKSDSVEYDAEDIKALLSSSPPPSSYWKASTTTSTSTTPTGWTPSSAWTGTSTSSGYFSFPGSYGWSELSEIDLGGLSFAIGHTITLASHYDQLNGIGLVCNDCGLRTIYPWAGSYGERVMVIGTSMLDMLRMHAKNVS